MRKIIGIHIFCFLFGISVMGQKLITDSVYHIKGIEIATDRFSNTLSGVKVEEIDTNTLKSFSTGNLSQLLLQHSSVFIKSNGLTGLSSVAIRGAATSQTAVLWNGFNIQNPMNGGMDISLIPVSFLDKVSIQYNGMSALYGSSAMGGAIHLSNQPEFNKGLNVSIGGSFGSFENYGANIKIGLSKPKTSIQLKAFYNEGKNDFPFINTAKYGNPKERQSNSEVIQYGAILENAIKIGTANLLNVRIWFQNSQRNIPPNMTQEFSNTNQNDKFIRTSAEWNRKGKKYNLFVRSAFFYEEYQYEEPEKNIFSTSGSSTSITESEIYFKVLPYHTLNIGLQYKYTGGFCDYYQHKQTQNGISAFFSYNIVSKKDRWKLNISLREGYSDLGILPFLPSVSADLRLLKELFLYANFSRNFRIPTLNDLYWYPGGNPELKPESGYAEELGIKHQVNWKKIKFNYTVSGFNNNTKNWIIWLPVSTYFSPQNIQAVWSIGAEINLKLEAQLKNCLLIFSGKATYVKASVQKSNNETAIGHQLIYTPELIGNTGFSIIYKTLNINFNMEYISRRYTSPDNSSYVDPYVLGNIFVSKDFHYKNFTFNIFFQANNIWNQTYQTIAWQVMPGFNFKTGIQINFKHFKNKKL